MDIQLTRKYNVAGPRYTSYPTVPYWDNSPSVEDWYKLVKDTFLATNDKEGISLYIHLPFCESLCTYCGCNTRITVNHAVEVPYIDTVLKEWEMYLKQFPGKPRIKEIHLGGGTPTFFSCENLEKLILGILKDSEIAPDHEFGFEGHPNYTHVEQLQKLYDLGFRRVSFGIQDFDQKVQYIIHRTQTFEQVKIVTEAARRIGYESVNYDLIYGLPLQTMATIIDTIEKVRELKPDRIAFYSYAHVPWLKPGQRRFTEDDLPKGEEKRALYEKGRLMLEDSGYLEIGMDHFALETDSLYQNFKAGLMHRNFMGYTDKKTSLLIGLGASSISETPTMYVQNEKHIEDYTTAIDKSGFALTKGHQLTKTQQNIRTHILRLMCTYQTEWSASMEDQIIKDICVDSMHELILDQLVVLQENKLAITEKGKDFIRNICAGIDFEFARPTQKVYSSAI